MSKIKYPIFIISKGRHDVGFTANLFLKHKVPFKLVIEPQEFNDYARFYDEKLLIKTPFSNLGQGSIPVRNFVWDHSIKEGHEKHWVVDDNIHNVKYFWVLYKVIYYFITHFQKSFILLYSFLNLIFNNK